MIKTPQLPLSREIFARRIPGMRMKSKLSGCRHVKRRGRAVAHLFKESSNIGFYQVPSLFTGTYVVTITAPSMRACKQSIELLVLADVVQLTTTGNGVVSSTLENATINQLPKNRRELPRNRCHRHKSQWGRHVVPDGILQEHQWSSKPNSQRSSVADCADSLRNYAAADYARQSVVSRQP